MEIIVTPREALNNGYWDKLCDLKGINIWAVNEGQIDSNEKITLSREEAVSLGIIKEE